MSTPTTEALEALYRACRACAADIAEFETITDPELLDDLHTALDRLATVDDPAPAEVGADGSLLTTAREIVAAWDWGFHHRQAWTPSPREVAAEQELERIKPHVVREYVKQADQLTAALARVSELQNICIEQGREIEQTLGQALGFPWYKDDQVNFPGATEAEGVCVGEHVAETLAALAAQELAQVKAERDRLSHGLKAAIEHWTKKREVNQRDGDRRASIVYGAVVERALEVLNGEDAEEPASITTGAGMHVISLEHDEESSQRGMCEAAERVARSVVKGAGGDAD